MTTQKPLTFITCGSVDDGKSTLIGRLLYESKALLGDQLQAIARSKHQRTAAGQLDLSLLTDGLEAEREQGITIDVAYRYFTTPNRKFIIADTPGHEQYTRNMVTGASNADAAVLLIDAARAFNADGQVQLLAQTRRHAAIVKLIGVKHIAVAINKLDLFQFDQAKFNQVRDAFAALAAELGIEQYSVFPVSALAGDNVVAPSASTPWYGGPTLLQWLESLELTTEVTTDTASESFRLAVQWVIRANGSSTQSVRRAAGRVSTGEVKVGDRLTVLPSGVSATIAGIYIGEQSLAKAGSGQSIAIEFETDIDVSRGDWLAGKISTSPEQAATNRVEADLCWLDTTALHTATAYWIKHGTQLSRAKVTGLINKLDLTTVKRNVAVEGATLGANDIGRVQLQSQRALWFGDHASEGERGRFVLIDPASNRTVAAGLVCAA
jgi:sulfate adenylyltransferase subunit 1